DRAPLSVPTRRSSDLRRGRRRRGLLGLVAGLGGLDVEVGGTLVGAVDRFADACETRRDPAVLEVVLHLVVAVQLAAARPRRGARSEEHTSELQSREKL